MIGNDIELTMAEPEVLERPPIREALIDLRVILNSSLEVGDFEQLWPQLEQDYPHLQIMHTLTGGLNVDAGDVTPIPPDIVVRGFSRRSGDELNVAQFRLDGFTFNRLGQYPGWEVVYDEAVRLWELYTSIAQPSGVERLATRFINDIELPFPIELDEILEHPPQIPETWPQRTVDFLTRFSLEDEAGHIANVTITPSTISAEGVTLVYDIEVYKAGPFSLDGPELEETFAALRRLKNEIFFGGLTDQAMEMLRGTDS